MSASFSGTSSSTSSQASSGTAPDAPAAATSPVVDGAERPAGRLPDPPGPDGIFWFGSIGELRKNPMDFYTRLAQEYGGISRFWYGRKATYLVADPELIDELLYKKRKTFLKNERYAELKRLIGNGLLLSEGATWKRQRAAAAPGFRIPVIKSQVPRMASLVDEYLDSWEPLVDAGQPFDLEPRISVITQALIGDWMFGPHLRQITDRVIEAQRELAERWPEPPKGLLTNPIPPVRKIKRLYETLDKLDACFFDAIRLERQRLAAGEQVEKETMLSILIETDDGQEPFTDQELRDQLMTLYMAGFETSASSVTWLFYRLSIHPEARRHFYDEIDQLLGGASPVHADLGQLDYVRRAQQETLRLYPPAYNFSRVPLEDQELGGYHIPAGCMVIVAPWATHRLPELWPNPDGFDPDRFLPEQVAGRHRCAFIPFGAGHRTCIGMGLSTVQMQVIMVRLAQRYQLDMEPGIQVSYVPGTVMRPANGMNVVVHRRAELEGSKAGSSDPGEEATT